MPTFNDSVAESANANASAGVLRSLLPIGDVSAGNWANPGGGALYLAIDEVQPDNADYINSGPNPVNDACEIRFAPANANAPGLLLSYEIGSVGGSLAGTVNVKCGSQIIATFQHASLGAVARFDRWLTPAQITAITNPADLRVEFVATGTGQTWSASLAELASANSSCSFPPDSGPPPASVQYMPPATSLVTDFEGTWTLVDGTVYLNGVESATYQELLLLPGSDFMFTRNTIGDWYYRVAGVFSTPSYHIEWNWGLWVYGAGQRLDPLTNFTQTDSYIGPTNTPDIYELELTSIDALNNLATYRVDGIDGSVGIKHGFTFSTDEFGINYLRVNNDPDLFLQLSYGGSLLSAFLPLALSSPGYGDPTYPGRTAVNVRCLIWIEGGNDPAFVQEMKLPGLDADNDRFTLVGDQFARIFWHSIPLAGTYELQGYGNSIVNGVPGSGAPVLGLNKNLKPDRWYCLEMRMVMNTPGVADGYLGMWVNGHLVKETTNEHYVNDPDSALTTFHAVIFHGGLIEPKGLMHYRIAKLACSTSYIGVPQELIALSNWPTWRQGRTLGVPFEITNTSSMYPLPAQQVLPSDMVATGGPITSYTIGGHRNDINDWSGFAWDGTAFYGVAEGGHEDQWSNKAFKVNLNVNAPQFVILNPGTPPQQVPTFAGAGAAKTGYFNDGLPGTRHVYYSNHFIARQNRVMMLHGSAMWGLYQSPHVNGFRLDTNVYDAAGTWPDPNVAFQNIVPTMARHPVTEDVYVGDDSYARFQRWNAAQHTWTTLNVTGGYPQWIFHGSLIDTRLNRWVYCAGLSLECIDLSNPSVFAYTTHAITDQSPGSTFASDAASAYTALIHDLDQNRYLLFTGDSNAGPSQARIYAIDPNTYIATKTADLPSNMSPYNGWLSRVGYSAVLGGVAFVPNFETNICFLPTRASP